MNRCYFYIYLLCVLSALCRQSVIASPKPVVSYLGIEQGLSNNAVTAIYQDYNGFMWFGTYDGLNRYDGYGFKIFRNIIGDTNSVAFNSIYTIEGDEDQNIWVGGQKGVNILNTVKSTFTTPNYLLWGSKTATNIRDEAHAIEAVKGKMMLVGMRTNGLFLFTPRSRTGIQVPFSSSEGGKRFFNVRALEFDPVQKTVYVFVDKIGLCILDEQRKTLHLVNSTITSANCIKAGTDDLWIGSDNGLYRFNKRTNTFSGNLMPVNSNIVNLSFDKNSTLWIASDGNGVWLLPPNSQTAQPLSKENDRAVIKSNSVFSVYEDADGRKWIATLRGGINIIEPGTSPFKHVVYESGGNNNLVNNFIFSFCEDLNKNIWIGTDGAGLRYWNRATNAFTNYRHSSREKNSISSDFITSIVRDVQNDIWFSTWYGGINRLKKSGGAFERFSCFNPVKNIVENNVWFVYEDSKKRLWASATNDGSLYLFNRAANEFEIFDDKIMNLQSLTEDREGNLWGGNYSSLIRLDTIHKKHTYYNIGYPVRSILEDVSGNFWIGTQEGGLLLFNRKSGTYKRYTTSEGLPNNTILRLLQDPKGNIWMSTFNGLSKFTPRENAFRNFYQTDGLQSNQFSFNAAVVLSSGEFLFGGINGFNVFYPGDVRNQNDNLKIFLSGLKIDNKPVEEKDSQVKYTENGQLKEITIPYNQAALSLDFIALTFSGADNINYAYFLQGWDKGWNYVNHVRTANYSRLAEGNYFFKVKVSNAANIWGEPATLLKIKVLPPFYRSWWAYLLYVLAVASTIYFYSLYKARQNKLRYKIKIAQIERTKEKELNEKKLSFFTNISHEFRTPLSLIINPVRDLLEQNEDAEKDRTLDVIHRNARRLLRLVDQLLLFKQTDSEMDALNLQPLNLFEFCKDLFSFFSQQAEKKQIDYQFVTFGKEFAVHADSEKMDVILFNLLSNAFKYTPEKGAIILELKELADEVEISVKDSGIGIPPETGDKLFDRFYQVREKGKASVSGFGIGLSLVKHFVNAHQGNVAYESEHGKGSTFMVRFPKLKKENALRENLSAPVMPVAREAFKSVVLPKYEEVVDNPIETVISDKSQLLVIDDDDDMRQYLVELFSTRFQVYQASGGSEGIALAREHLPDLIISDVMMANGTGIDLCNQVKTDPSLSHIPVILLTASSSGDFKLEGVKSGADDYIQKPFDKTILMARVEALLKSRTILQKYFYNEITLQTNTLQISSEYKEFLEKCMGVVERHIDDEQFNIKLFASEMGMSHSSLYKKVKSISGQSINAFIRFIRLRKAAELLINTDCNVNEASYRVGITDIKYFRTQFNKLFGLNPSEYIKKYRKSLNKSYKLSDQVKKQKE